MFTKALPSCWLLIIGVTGSLSADEGPLLPHVEISSTSEIMLDLADTGTDPSRINFSRLVQLPAEHAVISDVRDLGGRAVQQHAYMAYFDGKYWAMWSDGPGDPRPGVSPERHRGIVPGHDLPHQRVSYATSADGVHWSPPKDLSGPPRIAGFGWIARGYWERDGDLLALATHYNAPGYRGEGLSLEAFRWDRDLRQWLTQGTVLDDAMNNFPPKKLPSGQWLATRRDHVGEVSVMIGGVEAFDRWQVFPMAGSAGAEKPEEPEWYTLPDGKNIVGLIRDNGNSKRLLRVFSNDNGRTWSKMVVTNFPDARSKFFALRTSRGYYVLVSNANPASRNPLTLAVSFDGLIYKHLFCLIGGRHIDYPHAIEQDGHLLIAFSGAKQTMEVLKVSLADLDQFIAKDAHSNE